jgi:tetratricopeptide (TPR) repeat protein
MTWEEALSFFKEGVKSNNRYESLLAMAYTLGSLGRWNLAEKYCEKAVIERINSSDTSVGEALFFLAYCMRKWRPSYERTKQALKNLDRARELNAKQRADEDYEEPRNFKERATQILEWFLRSQRKGSHQWPSDGLPSVDEIDAMLQKALNLVADDELLKLQAINNICYFYSSLDDNQHEKVTLEKLDELLDSLKFFRKDENQWPASIVDTVIWARYRLGKENLSNDDLLNMVNSLSSLLSERRLSKEDKQEIEVHLREIDSRISARQL